MTTEQTICLHCNIELPRTYLWESPEENILADRFLGKFPVRKAAAFFFFVPKSDTASIIYDFKYHHDPAAARDMGRMMGREINISDFFSDIDAIVPVPLHPARYRKRGYNQSEEIALGLSEVTGLPVVSDLIRRIVNTESQTRLSTMDRVNNTLRAFQITDNAKVLARHSSKEQHLLLVDDVITTGNTLSGCYEALKALPNLTYSVLSVGCVRKR